MNTIERPIFTFAIEEDRIVHSTELSELAIIVGAGALPDDFVSECGRSKDGVKDDLEIVTRGGIAVKVEGSCRLQDALQLDQSHRHHDEVGCKVASIYGLDDPCYEPVGAQM